MEMIWWHQAWLPLWGHYKLMNRTLRWYERVEPIAHEIAMRQGFKGIRWMKMTDRSGEEATSKVGSFLIWQQPHLIYLAELLYRRDPRIDILERYGQLIDETATFMADFAFFAIAFNVKKMAAKARKQGNMPTNGGLSEPLEGSYTLMGCLQSTNKMKITKLQHSTLLLTYVLGLKKKRIRLF